MRIIRLTHGLEECLYYHGIHLFNTGQYFLAHETWETCWRGLGNGPKRLFYHALIQAAVALAHKKKFNQSGVVKMQAGYRAKLAQLPGIFMGLNLAQFQRDVDARLDCGANPPFLNMIENPFTSGEAERLHVPPLNPPLAPAHSSVLPDAEPSPLDDSDSGL